MRTATRLRVAIAAAIIATGVVAAQAPSAPAEAQAAPVYGPVLVGYTNHVHTSTSDNPPALVVTSYQTERVFVRSEISQVTHYNAFRRHSDNKFWESTCPISIYEYYNNSYKCTPAHQWSGYTYLGHRNSFLYRDVYEDRTTATKTIQPVNHAHPVYETRCIANCTPPPVVTSPAPTTTRPPVITSPPPATTRPAVVTTRPGVTTTPPGPTTLPPPPVTIPDPVPADPVRVSVDFFRQGQTGGSLTDEQLVRVTASPITCAGATAPCGAAPGTGFSGAGNYGPIPLSVTATSLTVTPPPGYTQGTNPGVASYNISDPFPAGSNLLTGSRDMGLRFYRPTAEGDEYQLTFTGTATVQYVAWQCNTGLLSCPAPSQRTETATTQTVPITVTYRPNADGRFEVIGAIIRP